MQDFRRVKCYVCKKYIDTSKATTDPKHEYARFMNHNIYMHMKCLEVYEDKLSKMMDTTSAHSR